VETHFLTQRVTALYTAHPYPKYPLLAKPKLRGGYMTHTRFSEALSGSHCRVRSVVVAGAGEILPYMIRHWEGATTPVTFVDLSAKSLGRARFRLLTSRGKNNWCVGSFDRYLETVRPGSVGHFDAFGVLHHMANPRGTLHAMSQALAPGGTIRLMVYNQASRSWLRHIQLGFSMLGLSFERPSDIRLARAILETLSCELPALQDTLSQIPRDSWANQARFADMFLHPREAQVTVDDWLTTIQDSGLTIAGLFDRYGEFDDLDNPLIKIPEHSEIIARSRDGRYEGNLEFFLSKPGVTDSAAWRREPPTSLLLAGPPDLWFQYDETRHLPLLMRWRLWHAHLNFVYHGKRTPLPQRGLTDQALGRLARLGAVFPAQRPGSDWLTKPLAPILTAPVRQGAVSLDETAIQRRLTALIMPHPHLKPQNLPQALKRFHLAQIR